MTITKEQVKDLQPGDVVEITDHSLCTARGPLRAEVSGSLSLGRFCIVRFSSGDPACPNWSLTVISRAPRAFYVNHDREKPWPGDVVRDADDDADTMTWNYAGGAGASVEGWYDRDGDGALRRHLPTRLRLLVDGETGRCVP